MRWIVRGYLEVRAGRRSHLTLRGLLDPKLYRRIRAAIHHPIQEAARGSDPRGDLGGAVVSRGGYDRVFGVVAVRESDERWDVIMIELQRTPKGTWQVTDLGPLRQRVTAGRKP